jgi:glutamate-5-semialdehyde dehydrogenase
VSSTSVSWGAEHASPIRGVAEAARRAARIVAKASGEARSGALAAIADAIDASRSDILAANERDLAAARAAGLSPAMLDRLRLDEARTAALARAVR